ncbi:hypothetical protein XSR1_400030 [Xenorhabdus szentirmaii DSM 16338]|uniref:Uncharacterized protein n=1 Tax=Xenorhabdus szentirmaii DSM 16338 TaxID=1427518 RepID=W1J0D4_9GAMM|nr:hypothetical protein XSR1_400030 [Xenorhabdus szentirmaii DSM 16338]
MAKFIKPYMDVPRLMEHIRDNSAKEVYEDAFFSIRYYQRVLRTYLSSVWS